MSIYVSIQTGHSGTYVLNCRIEETFDELGEAFARLDELKPMLGIGTPMQNPGTAPLTRVAAKHWSQEECDAIAGARSRREALQMYRATLPQMDRTDAGIIKQYCKLLKNQAAAPTPISAGDEVTQHEPEPEPVADPDPEPSRKRPKNAWLPEEDDIIRDASSSAEAARLHTVVFPGKRTPAAINMRWRMFNQTSLQNLKEIAASKPALPGRDTIVRFTEAAGRVLPGKTGKVIRRDEFLGEVLVDLGASDGSVWTPPQALEVVSSVLQDTEVQA